MSFVFRSKLGVQTPELEPVTLRREKASPHCESFLPSLPGTCHPVPGLLLYPLTPVLASLEFCFITPRVQAGKAFAFPGGWRVGSRFGTERVLVSAFLTQGLWPAPLHPQHPLGRSLLESWILVYSEAVFGSDQEQRRHPPWGTSSAQDPPGRAGQRG